MSFIAAAAIIGGTSYLAAREAGKGGGGVEYGAPPESEEVKKARKKLFEFAEGPPPAVPLRKIAPLPEITEERELARETAKELIQPQDFMALPEVQGIIQEARVTGNLLGNRLSRMLQASGALTSTPGRDVLGRAVTDVQKSVAASLAPFAMEERGRRTGLISLLETLGLTEEERKRAFEQAGLSAEFEKEYAESKQLETFTIPLLQSIIGQQPAVQPIIQGQQPSFLTQAAPLLGPILGAALTPKPAPGFTPLKPPVLV